MAVLLHTPQFMPSYEEVEAAGNAAFVPPDSSKLREAPADLAAALGLTDIEEQETTPSVDLAAEQQAEEEAQKVIQSREARIQEKSEELYRTEERLALKDPAYLQKLIDSKDAEDRKFAGKILKRNADTFGASSVEDYKKVQIINAATTPTEKKLATQDLEISSLKQKQELTDWSQWKKDNSVGEDISTVADDIRTSYPEMSYGDVLALARGRGGLSQTSSQKTKGSAAVGSSGAPETDDSAYTSPLAKRLLKDPESTLKFAKGYIRNLNS